MTDIGSSLAAVRERIDAACARAGRDPASVTLLGVSKTKPASAVRDALAAGLLDFGENRVQEADAKIAEVGETPARWHLIGRLQSNKAKRAAQLFDAVHSLDRVSLVGKLDRHRTEFGGALSTFVQVEFARSEATDEEIEASTSRVVEAAAQAQSLRLLGLMTLPPYSPDPEATRGYFRRLRQLRDTIESRSGVALPELSMGMSNDFEVAIEEGATTVRVGTTIFGQRHG